MTLFLFHVDAGGKRAEAEEAIELPDLEAARDLAMKAAVELAADDLKSGQHKVHQVVVIADEERDLLSVRVEAALIVERS
jgi:hypothetical protein